MASPFSSRLPSRKHQGFRPRLEELENRVAPVTDIFTVAGNAGEMTAVNFTFLSKQGVFQNEIGVYRIDNASGSVLGTLPGQAGYAQLALTLGQTVVASGAKVGNTTTLTFEAGTQLAFYLVQNNNRNAVLTANPQNAIGGGAIAFFSVDGASPDNFDHVRAVTQGDGGMRLEFEDLTFGGDRDFNDAVISVGGNGLIRTPGQAGQFVPTTFNWVSREAAFLHEVGIFQVSDALGRVNGLLPGAPGYAQAALQNAQVVFSLGQSVGAVSNLTLPAAQRFGLYLIPNATTAGLLQTNPNNLFGAGPLAYFSIFRANPDGVAHFDFLSGTDFAFEDVFGGGDFDFNDMGGRITFGTPFGTPLDDGVAPLITARLFNDTFDPSRPAGASDLRTNDPSITGTVMDSDQIVAFRASIDNVNVNINILDTLQPDGTFLLDRNRIEAIFDPTNNPTIQLTQGVHTLRLQAIDEFGNASGVFTFQFTFDSVGPTTTLLLAQASDTGVVGEFRTDNATVTLMGTTEANSPVRLVRTSTNAPNVEVASTTADANGNFLFTNVPLVGGPNGYKVFTLDIANNQGESGATITRNTAPTADAVPTLANLPSNDTTMVNLTPKFADIDNNMTVVRVSTNLGDFLIQLFDDDTPIHALNFLNYVGDGDYDGTIFHRSVPGFVIQGGGFRFVNANPNLIDLPADAAILNEPGLPNSRGTIALAKVGGDPNSGTNEWFVNLGDNVLNLDNQNGGFTVFGQVVGNGQQTYDAIAAVPRFNLGGFEGLPLQNFAGNNLQDADDNNFIIINSVTVLADPLTYTIVSNSDETLVQANIVNNQLVLTNNNGMSGAATIVVRATDPDGTASTTDHVIQVTVGV